MWKKGKRTNAAAGIALMVALLAAQHSGRRR